MYESNTDNALGQMPGWILRYGISALILILFLFLLLCNFVRYPETITSNITIFNNSTPIPIISRTSGDFQFVNITNGQLVEKNKILAILDNSADPLKVIELKKSLDALTKYDDLEYLREKFVSYNRLGKLQKPYNAVIKELDNWESFMRVKYHEHKITIYEKQLKTLNEVRQNQLSQCNLYKEELELEKIRFSEDSTLFVNSSVSEERYIRSKKTLIQNQIRIEEERSKLLATEMKIQKLIESIQELKDQRLLLSRGYIQDVQSKINALTSEIIHWEKLYVLKSPISGQVVFHDDWHEHQYVNIGDSLLTVIPINGNSLIGKLKIPIKNLRQVYEGQNVSIRLERYPYTQYGLVNASIASITNEPSNNFYTVEVTFPNKLRSTYGINLEFVDKMVGEAHIITREISLLERVFHKSTSFVKFDKAL